MRTAAVWLAGGLAALVMVDHAWTGTGAGLVAAPAPSADLRQEVMRSGKADRLSVAPARPSQHKIATVEVIGVEQAAIVYRDREGRELYRTDPIGNATVVVRGLSLPAVTLREAPRSPTQPVVLDAGPAANKPPPPAHRPKLPDGCEPAYSLLTGAGSSSLHARCVADLGMPSRLAALH